MNLKSVVLVVVLLINVLVNGQVQFNTSSNCGGTGCDWSIGANWVGGIVPGSGADVVIDYSAGTVTAQQTISLAKGAFTYKSLTIKGAQLNNAPNVVINMNAMVTITMSGELELSNTIFTTSASITVYSLTVSNSSVMTQNDASDTTVTTASYFDSTSKLELNDKSGFTSNGVTSFKSKPKCYENTCSFNFLGPFSMFYMGVNSQGLVTMQQGTLAGGSSTIQTLTVMSALEVQSGAKLIVLGSFHAGNSQKSTVTIDNGGSIEVSGQGSVTLYALNVAVNGTAIFASTQLNVAGYISSQGFITINTPNGAIQNSTISELVLQGLQTSIEINNSNFGEIHCIMNNDGNQSLVQMQFVGASSAINITSAGSAASFTVIDESSLTVTGDVKLIGSGGIFVMGKLNLEGAYVVPGASGIALQDPNAELYVNNAQIVGDIVLGGGSFTPIQAQIFGNVIVNNGYLTLNYPGSNLAVEGFQLSTNGTLYIFDSQVSSNPAPFVANTTFITGTIIVQFQNSIEFNGQYPLIQVNTPPMNLSASTLSPIYNNVLYESQDYDITYSPTNQAIQMDFFTEESPSKKMAGWKIFLIILSIFAVLGGGAYAFYKYRRNQGYISLN
ncbi:hypothetical protein DLAC_07076 [Tieghemostelium lacteum]|uniref:Transmembrane protein n=1 Tax=Tieghemostelium lacteum TaxID=361077 RepID=A0A151ZE84_TIELA|nr:hypothetical protein DLAC_07076 [Tieghemostelium lacteum]|eukprot:KYQ92229.1 hypothetical protein DLAC_07076 [Tieghemostelium lacteum]